MLRRIINHYREWRASRLLTKAESAWNRGIDLWARGRALQERAALSNNQAETGEPSPAPRPADYWREHIDLPF